jgi:hypothetical protein
MALPDRNNDGAGDSAGDQFIHYFQGGKDSRGRGAGLGGSIGGAVGMTLKERTGLPFDMLLDPGGAILFGDQDNPGLFGTGRFKPNMYQIQGGTGGGGGVPGYGSFQDGFSSGLAGLANRPTTQIDGVNQGAIRGQQSNLAAMLAQQASGQGGPSAAQLQLEQAMGMNAANAAGLLAGQRGQNAGAAARQVANQQAAIGQQTAMDTALLRANEQIQAQNNLGQLLQGMRGQDLQIATGNAQLGVQQQQMKDQMTQFYLQQGSTLAQAQQQAAMEMEKLRVNQNIEQNKIESGAYQQTAQGMGNVMSAASSLMSMFSDERLKEDVTSGDERVDAILDRLGTHAYRYKAPEGEREEGEHLSVMAQELEQTELKRAVKETPRGKLVNYGETLPFMLTALARAHRRLKVLESGKRGAK